MSLGSRSSREAPRLLIAPYGGTIMSQQHLIGDGESRKEKFFPRIETVHDLKKGVSQRLWDEYNSVSILSKSNDDLIDSAQAEAHKHIQNMVYEMRTTIAEGIADVIIVLSGTDTIADLTTALGNGISKKELGNSAVIVTGAMYAPVIEHSDAKVNFRDAVTLGLHEQVRGKIGLCMSARFFPPRGLQKIQLNSLGPIICRFRRMAKRGQEWNFDRRAEVYDEPRGEYDRPYELKQGVETILLTPTSSYENLKRLLQNEGTVLVAPGDANLRADEQSKAHLRAAAEMARGPVIVVGSAIQNRDIDERAVVDEYKDTTYLGNASTIAEETNGRILFGGAMTETEAHMFLSQALAELPASATVDEKCAYVLAKLEHYPISRDPSHIEARKKKKGKGRRKA